MLQSLLRVVSISTCFINARHKLYIDIKREETEGGGTFIQELVKKVPIQYIQIQLFCLLVFIFYKSLQYIFT